MSVSPEMIALCRRSAAESCVLLKNEPTEADGKPILPLERERPVAVFGAGQLRWMDMGYGSGGDVVKPYSVHLIQGLEQLGAKPDAALCAYYKAWDLGQPHGPFEWGRWPLRPAEPPVSEAIFDAAAKRCDTAIVVLSRAVGESIDLQLTEGEYYLHEEERSLLAAVKARFSRIVILLNIGNLIDLSWTDDQQLDAVLAVWHGGMESGNAVADVLYGEVNPCGKLADTIAVDYEDYPASRNFGGSKATDYEEDIYLGYRWFHSFASDRQLYSFGYGLSYTEFGVTCTEFSDLRAVLRVTNNGDRAGKEVVQLYCAAPQGMLGKPAVSLCAFAKTKLLAPGESQELALETTEYALSSYDDGGKTGHRNCWVLEKGTYHLYFGVRSDLLALAGSFEIAKTKVTRKCKEYCAPAEGLMRLTADGTVEPAPSRKVNLKARIRRSLPAELPPTGDCGIRFEDVRSGKATLESFVAQLSDAELEALTRGEGAMDSDLAAPGNAGAFGGVLPSLREKGIPAVITTDGPSGVRLRTESSLTPCAAALACTWDVALVEALMAGLGKELPERHSDVQLAPGMNIHRNPLCGRNFEYYSEDPLLTGKLAAAAVRGIQSAGVSACPKHFCCNNQEFMRNSNDSRVSQRALREIYLRGFEICVREAAPQNLMTSYNRLNGVWNHYNFELIQGILRGEWGYQGCVMTDWWLTPAESPEFPGVKVHAYRVRAGVDVFMPGNHSFGDKAYASDGTLWGTLGQPGGITRGEVQRCAGDTLRFLLAHSGAN